MHRFFLLFISFFIFYQISFCQNKLKEVKKIDSIYKLNIDNKLKTIALENFINKKINLNNENKAYAYHRLGILYSIENKYNKAIHVTEKSINIRKLTDSIDYYKLNNSFYNLNYYYKVLGNVKKQKGIIIKLQNQPVKNKFTYKSYIDLGFIFTNKGDYFNALKIFQNVIDNYPSYNDPKTLLKAHEAVIAVYSYIDETNRYLKEIKHHTSSIDTLIQKHHYLSTDIGYKNNLANIFENLNKPFKVIDLYEEVLKVYEKNNDYENIGRVYSNIGRVYNKINQRDKADYFFDKALNIKTDKKAIAAVYSNKGDYLSPEIKIRYNKKAIGILLKREYEEKALTLKEIKNSDYKLDILDYLIENVNAGIKNYEFTKKNSVLNTTIEMSVLVDKLISFIRLESIVDTSKLFWIRKAASFYMQAVTLSYYKKDVSQAFYFMEKNKALLLLEGLNNNSENNKKEPLIISLEESVKQYTNKDKSLIEYILNEQIGYGIFCNENERIFFKLKNVPDLINEVDSLKSKMSEYFIYKDDEEKYKRLANKVFLKLFPFKNAIDKIKNKELIVIPDYKLQRINFEALIPDILRGEYLLEHTEINYLLSASVFEKLNKNKENAMNKILAFAPVNFKHNTLNSLKRSKNAMQEIASICETDLFLEDKAKKETFLNEIKKYAIIHLNTHAGIDKIENKPWIAFHEKKISLIELLGLSNNAELVVLDACNGASGKQEIGEGIMSLSRGFFRGGAKCVIATQWKANEKATNEILQTFYKELKKGKTKSKALQIAKKNYINTHQLSEISPYYWASLILTGSSDSIKITSHFNYNWIWFTLLVMLIILFLAKGKKHNSKLI